MEPGKDSASPPRISLWPLALLGTLVSVLALFSSRRTNSQDTAHAQDNPDHKTSGAPILTAALKSESIPANTGTNQSSKRDPWWKPAAAIAQVIIALVTLGLLLVNLYQMKATKKTAKAAIDANKLTRTLLKGSYSDFINVDIGMSIPQTPQSELHTILNIGFENHGKMETTLHSQYTITIITIPDKAFLRFVAKDEKTDRVPRQGESPMPNHYYKLRHLIPQDIPFLQSGYEAIKIEGTMEYDDGFGEIISTPICKISRGPSVGAALPCDEVDAYLPPPLNPRPSHWPQSHGR